MEDDTGQSTSRLQRLRTRLTAIVSARADQNVSRLLHFIATRPVSLHLFGRTEPSIAPQSAVAPEESRPAEVGVVASPIPAELSAYVKQEAIYPRVYVDLNGDPLDGGAHYQIVGNTDMQAVWWAVTIYNERFDLLPDAERHSFTSLNTLPMAGSRRFVIDVAPEWPEGAANWLPSRRGEPFNLVWRFYQPGAEAVGDPDGIEVPSVTRVPD